MSLFVKNHDETFILIPEGKHVARCYAIIDLGIQENKVYGTKSPKVLLGWELSNLCASTGKPFTLMQQYTANLNPKSTLKKLLESWRGKPFALEDLHGFQLENMLSCACYLMIKHKINLETNRIRSMIEDILPFPDEEPLPKMHYLPISFDLDYYTQEDYLSIPEHIRKRINVDQPRDNHHF